MKKLTKEILEEVGVKTWADVSSAIRLDPSITGKDIVEYIDPPVKAEDRERIADNWDRLIKQAN